MFFWLKKAIGYLVEPLPFCLLLMVLGAGLMLWSRRTRAGRTLMLSGLLLLIVFSNKAVSAWLVRPLESRYAPVPELIAGAPIPRELAACRYVVVLGAGNGNTPGVAALSLLSAAARSRVTEAVRLLRAVPEAQLLVSGPPVRGNPSHASVLARAAISLGVDPQRIVSVERVRDTEDEAHAVREKIGDTPVALVTSAAHMRRAQALFRHAGVNALPCPTDFTGHDDGRFHARDLLFDFESLERSTWAIRERVGYLWISLRGRT